MGFGRSSALLAAAAILGLLTWDAARSRGASDDELTTAAFAYTPGSARAPRTTLIALRGASPREVTTLAGRTAPGFGVEPAGIALSAAAALAALTASTIIVRKAATMVGSGRVGPKAMTLPAFRLQTRVALCAAEGADVWAPRTTGWSVEDLQAERNRAETDIAEPPATYKGPRYSGPKSLTQEFVDTLIDMQAQGTILPKKDMYLMVLDVIELLRKENTIQDVTIPSSKSVVVVGDLHGQYWDFMNLLKLAGRPSPESPFIFNGDFVDRGSWSIEVISVLFAFKLKDPSFVFLNRGNHEMLETNILYGFCGECGAKYDMCLFDLFSEAFRRLPLGHLVEEKLLVLHAGLPGPDPRVWMPGQTHDPTDAIPITEDTLPTLQDLREIDRYMEITPESYAASLGPITSDKDINDRRRLIDILWGDPRGGIGYGPSYRKGKGVFMFGPDVSALFCERNKLQAIIRSHEVKAAGYRWDHPQVLTVFSAPNYLDTGNNQAAFLRLTKTEASAPISIETVTFAAVPHPDLPPMHWQEHVTQNFPHLTRKMKKKVVQEGDFDAFGDSDFEGLMNFDEWEPDEADQFQEAFKVDAYGRDLPEEALPP